ncbi:MAG: DNA repair protein RadA [Elusimicrobia bacterium GWA2_69_24]|nr:MAG: DNA repair protein RadA [Elusimicrobia bacterium GWA2_69_24]
MARLRSVYSCSECGHSEPKWAGQCPGCGAWSSLVEEAVEVRSAAGERAAPRSLTDFSSEVVPLSGTEGPAEERLATGIGEFDRLLGGGLVAGQVALLAGPPGIGKSTLMLQVAGKLASSGKVLYVSGEESLGQISGRAKRLGVRSEQILLLAETDLHKIVNAISEHGPRVVVLDSIQTVCRADMTGGAGSVGQVRECAAELLRAVKKRGSVLFLLGHVTKEGSVAGPMVLEHLVDTVLQFDLEARQSLRILRAQKNRFGSASELGLFEMFEGGLREVSDASAFFIEELGEGAGAGRAVSVAMEGNRPILAEVQALVTPTRYPLPRRMATGLDLNRVLVLVASLEKHLRLRLESKDVYLNVAGGLRLRDPALELAACLAILSSARDEALPADQVFLGEVGLLGRLGRIGLLDRRLQEAGRAGFKKAVVSARSLAALRQSGGNPSIEVFGAEDLRSAAAVSFKENP